MKKIVDVLCGALAVSVTLAAAMSAGHAQEDTPISEPGDSTSEGIALPPITVTSQKIEENLQQVPMSIEVFTNQQVQDRDIRDIDDVSKNTPNFSIDKSGGRGHTTSLSIRGVTSGNADFANPTVGLFVDGVSLGGGYDIDFYDVERIEVLRGPQGTLYGSNTLGGVVNILSVRPQFEWSANADVSGGRYSTYEGRAAVGGPITDDVAFRLTGTKLNSDGYLRNTFRNQHSENRDDYSLRGQLRYKPTESLDFNLNLNGFDYNGRFGSYAPLTEINENHHEVQLNEAGSANQSAFGQILDASYNADDFSFKSISGHRYWRSTERLDADFTPEALASDRSRKKNDQYTQEFRFTSPADADRLIWITGLYFAYEDQLTGDSFTVNPPLFGVPTRTTFRGEVKVDTYNYGIFGQASYGVTDKLFLTAGLRYDYVVKELDSNSDTIFTGGRFVGPRLEADTSFDAILPRGALEYRWTPEIMTYASITAGYKPGGYQTFNFANANVSYDSEYSLNYELGFKTSFFDERLRLNGAAFYIDIEDQQFATLVRPNVAVLSNAARSHSMGFELEATALLTPGWEMFGSFGYIDAEIDKVKSGTTGTFSGARPTNVPRYSGTIGTQYRDPSGLFALIDCNVVGDYYLDGNNTVRQDPFFLLNARVGWEFENFGIYAFGTNLLDEHYLTNGFSGTLPGQGFVAREGQPLMVGLMATAQF